jgi:DNA-binding transcriptional LysR family regulator
MELRHLRYFTTLAETLNYTRASGILYISQSALSQQIVDLEEELKTTLFLRTKRSVELTDSGKILLEEARKVLRQVEQLTFAVHESTSFTSKANSILVGLEIGSVHDFYLRRAITNRIFSLRERDSSLQVNILVYEHNALIQALENQAVDVGFFLHQQPVIKQHTELTSLVLYKDEMVLAICSQQALKDTPSTLQNILLYKGIILLEKEERGMYQVMRILEELKIEPSIHFVPDRETMILSVENGDRATVLPSCILNEIQNPYKQILHFGVSCAKLYCLAVWQPGNHNPLIMELVNSVRGSYKNIS